MTWRTSRLRGGLIRSLVGLAAFVPGCENRVDVSYCEGGSEIFPGQTLRDWKSYADYLVAFEVVDRDASGDGIPVATLENERVLWRAQFAPTLPSRIALQPAWPYEVGDRFVSPVAKIGPASTDGWVPVGACSPMPVEDGRIRRPSTAVGDAPAQDKLAGRTLDAAAEAFERQRMDPVALRLQRIRPRARVQAVFDARRGRG